MGTVVKRFAVLAAVGALLVPAGANAGTTWYGPGQYQQGPVGGSPNATSVSRDTSTGEVRALQFQFTAVSSSLGCTGQGPFAYFDVPHTGSVSEVVVEFSDAVVSPYAFLKVSLLLDGQTEDTYVATRNVRGPILLDGSILGPDGNVVTLALDEAVDGPVIARVGLEVSSNCPSVDGGRIIIDRVGFVETPPDQDG